jgi:hypothetical protein
VNRPLFLLALAGCDTFGSIRATGRPVGEAYAAPHELRVLDVDSPLRAEKKVPVLSTPEVFAAYVPTRAEGDRMIGDRGRRRAAGVDEGAPGAGLDPDRHPSPRRDGGAEMRTSRTRGGDSC